MANLKEFRIANKLLQKEIAEYLGISRNFISIVESGKANLPREQLEKLIANDKGWDISALAHSQDNSGNTIRQTGDSNVATIGRSETAGDSRTLERENELLRDQIAELRAEKERYLAIIETLSKKG